MGCDQSSQLGEKNLEWIQQATLFFLNSCDWLRVAVCVVIMMLILFLSSLCLVFYPYSIYIQEGWANVQVFYKLDLNLKYLSQLSGLSHPEQWNSVKIREHLPVLSVPDSEKWRLGLITNLFKLKREKYHSAEDFQNISRMIDSLCST